ncbi:hypothetical protein GCM10025868_22990 [Angustibacter aerolatus]|uniref:Uncharacterized protein n=1 Tax=Angustibacter aerolatus TaxID=1162965 RepID=A0ABQ6JIX2_9ACTN|nr:hypothetical protein GCM10025868_22990 [Angustibacter aerolatus]
MAASTTGTGFDTRFGPSSPMARAPLQVQPPSVERAVTTSKSPSSPSTRSRRSANATRAPLPVRTTEGMRYQRFAAGLLRNGVHVQDVAACAGDGATATRPAAVSAPARAAVRRRGRRGTH